MERDTDSSKYSILVNNCAERVMKGLNGTPEPRVVEKVYNELCDLDSSTDGLEILHRYQSGICFMNIDKEYFLTHQGSAFCTTYGSHDVQPVDISDFFTAYVETLKLKRGL